MTDRHFCERNNMNVFNIILTLLIHCHHVVVSQQLQYTNIETVSKSMSLPPCKSDSAVIFLETNGQVVTSSGQGFVTVCVKKNSSSHGWALIRDDNMTEQLVYAVCRQNGYFGSFNRIPKTLTSGFNVNISYTISSVNCPNVKNYGNGAQVLARCAFGGVNDGVAKDYYLYISCTSQGQADKGYSGQVKVIGYDPNIYRQVQLYYAMDGSTQKWRNVCVKKDSANKIANSVCRQLGYTNANNQPLLDSGLNGWKIEGDLDPLCTCTDCSLPCFTQCWQNNFSISAVESCDGEYGNLRLVCEFNSDRAISMSSGSQALCQYQRYINTTTCAVTDCNSTDGKTTGPSWSSQFGPGFIASTINVLLVAIITCIAVCCLRNTRGKLRQIQQNVDDLPQDLQNNMQQDFQAVQQDIQGLQQNIQQDIQGVQQDIQGAQQDIQGIQQNVQGIQGVQQDIQGLQQNLQLLQDVPQNIQELVDALQDLRQNMQEEIRQVREQNLLNGPH